MACLISLDLNIPQPGGTEDEGCKSWALREECECLSTEQRKGFKTCRDVAAPGRVCDHIGML